MTKCTYPWGALILRRVYSRLDHEADEIMGEFLPKGFNRSERKPLNAQKVERYKLICSALEDVAKLIKEFGMKREEIYQISTDAGSRKFLPFTR